MSGDGFRLEWRRALFGASPYRAVAAFVTADRGEVAREAIARCRNALDGEFRLVRTRTGIRHIVYTRARELSRWSSGDDDLPEAAERPRWLSESRDAVRAARASSGVVSALVEAVESGAVGECEAARLFGIFESSLLACAAARGGRTP